MAIISGKRRNNITANVNRKQSIKGFKDSRRNGSNVTSKCRWIYPRKIEENVAIYQKEEDRSFNR